MSTRCECMKCFGDDNDEQCREAIANHVLQWARKKKQDRQDDLVQILRYPVVAEEIINSMGLNSMGLKLINRVIKKI